MTSKVTAKLIGLTRFKKRVVQVLADIILMVACFWLAMILRLESTGFSANPQVWVAFLPVVPVTVLTFRQLGLYRSVIRYITGQVFRLITLGVLVSAITLFVSSQLFAAPVPRSVPGIYAVILVLAAGGLRFLFRTILRLPMVSKRTPVAIYGAGASGRQLLNALLQGREYTPLFFIDDDPSLYNTLVSGHRVFPPARIAELVRDYHIRSILLAIPSASQARRREIIAEIGLIGLEIKTIPGIADIVSGRATFSELRRVSPEDLLGRDPVPPRPELMSRNITGKVVLVSGAGGSIGSELCRQLIQQNPASLILLEVSEFALYTITTELREVVARVGSSLRVEPILGSVQNRDRVSSIIAAFGVQTIYHAAAYKHVTLVEENVVEGVVNNVFGTMVLAEEAAAHGVESFILISTDKAVRPTNFMGASKRMAELVCQSLTVAQDRTTFSMVRFGNVLGSSGSVIPRFNSQIQHGGPVTVTHREITRFFMTIPEAAQLVIQAGAMAKGGDVFVLDMGDPVKILDLAQSMIRLHGLKPYVIELSDLPDPLRGDIAIQIVGLNKGEKLYEELLIGNNPKGTGHPRIMTASEVSMTGEELQAVLERLQQACAAFDIPAIRQIFLDAPLGYQPNGPEIHDLTWNAVHTGDPPVKRG